MKTIEIVNGQKVWAVDTDGICDRCMFEECGMPKHMNCASVFRADKRNVIFQPYEEEQQEKTFTLSQINEVIDEMYNNQTTNPYFEAGRRNALVVLKQKFEQL